MKYCCSQWVSVQTSGTYFVLKNLPPELKLAMKMPYLVFFTSDKVIALKKNPIVIIK